MDYFTQTQRMSILKQLGVHTAVIIGFVLVLGFSLSMYIYGCFHLTMHTIGTARALFNR